MLCAAEARRSKMSAPLKKTPAPEVIVRRQSTNPPSSTAAPTQNPSEISASTAPKSVSSARAAARKQSTTPSDTAGQDVKAEMTAQVEELRERLQQSEQAAEEVQKQAAVLRIKLDEALKEQGILEESVHEHSERIEEMENAKREALRAKRELEVVYESERVAVMREKDEVQAREIEMQSAIQRLKETLAQRDLRAGLDDERRPSFSRNCRLFGSLSVVTRLIPLSELPKQHIITQS